MAEIIIVDSDAELNVPKTTSSLCNICKNFKNIHNPAHRKSKVHQKKLSDRFCVIREKMKDIKPCNITVHDEDWKSDDAVFCYFCNESIQKHAIYDGITVESLGYLKHLTSFSHQTEVINYLKYHERGDDFKIFCKPEKFLKSFIDHIPEAKKKYLEKLDALHIKDVKKIIDIETERKEFLKDALEEHQCKSSSVSSEPVSIVCASSSNPEMKIPPWLASSSKSAENSKPTIGPTIKTLTSHLHKKQRKSLPPKRLKNNLNKKNTNFNKKWLPPFSGVWNKGRTRNISMKD